MQVSYSLNSVKRAYAARKSNGSCFYAKNEGAYYLCESVCTSAIIDYFDYLLNGKVKIYYCNQGRGSKRSNYLYASKPRLIEDNKMRSYIKNGGLSGVFLPDGIRWQPIKGAELTFLEAREFLFGLDENDLTGVGILAYSLALPDPFEYQNAVLISCDKIFQYEARKRKTTKEKLLDRLEIISKYDWKEHINNKLEREEIKEKALKNIKTKTKQRRGAKLVL